jgi:hypothetical protein
MRQPPTPPPQVEGLQVYQTEQGVRAEFRAGLAQVIVTAPSQEVAVAACTAAAARLAESQGRLPRLVADRTLPNLVAALKAAP